MAVMSQRDKRALMLLGIAVALVGRNHPLGIVLAALFIAVVFGVVFITLGQRRIQPVHRLTG